ncbi:MAG: exodeoxyribonuclease III [Candidatus Saccharibacteria bacterium]|nr:exodeoxyribonuclease III [Candidatus Saccharibacteria bacterium]
MKPTKKSYNIFSWNVNGIRSVLKKGALQNLISTFSPELLCLQETKAKPGQAETDFENYEEFWNSADRPGYSGTATFTKIPPLEVNSDFTPEKPIEDTYGSPLSEGRVLTLELPEFYLVNVYVPNSKPDLSRLPLRKNLWGPAFSAFLRELDSKKPVVVCGDFNVAHKEIDLARPNTNHHHAGFTDEEREDFTNLLSSQTSQDTPFLLDTFREKHPEKIQYSWWSHWGHARENNVGWRIDYFLISSRLKKHLLSATIHDDILGSDHCPISITLEF